MDNKREELDRLRHSAAHLLAAAILELYPGTKNTIGPAIENGFYYDFDFEQPISEEDLPKIEAKMHELVKDWATFERQELSAAELKEQFSDNPYKLELIEEFGGQGQTLTTYKSGNFTDFCRGGHSANPSQELKAFKLLSVAGAYWRGNEKNKMLTRIYGTAFATQAELDDYLNMIEEAKRRDHKRLGQELDLFTFSTLVGPGLPLWTPKGTVLRNLLDGFVWQLRKAQGYQKVEIPHITKKELYEVSGHWDKFKDELFRINTREGHEFAMKPMNCPHHTQIYARKKWSYRELPQRYANTTTCYRDEQTGELSGLSRTRAFWQDDAHVFARMSQVKTEFMKIWDIIYEFYSVFGFDLRVRLSLHDPAQPEKYLGDKERWSEAEEILRQIVSKKEVESFEGVGEAAFYGPKLDFMAKDAIGRDWQVATIQLDMNMPERFDLSCVDETGKDERIVMIHAAIMGSIERFMSILIEHTAGAFPTWLAPVQATIVPISEKHVDYANKLLEQLNGSDIRTEVDARDERMQAKIRDAQLAKVPYMLIVGDKEAESGDQVSVRNRNNENLGVMTMSEFLDKINSEIESKSAL